MRLLILALVIALVGMPLSGCLPASASGVHEELYAGWDSALHKYVNSKGEVNYRGWKNDRAGLDSFFKSAGNISSAQCAQMSRDEKLALWINIYNAFTVKLVLDHYPIGRTGFNLYPSSSIRQIDGVWDRYRVSVCGRNVTLSEIENKVLRSEFGEPLIHFAINCASRSCPRLMNRAYTGGGIGKELEESAGDFVADSSRNKFDVSNHKVEISRIFDWFGDDFKGRYSGKAQVGRSAKDSAVINFLLAHTQDRPIKEVLESNKFSLGYLPYDWSLNEEGTGH